MRFLGLDLNDRVLDAKTIWLFWERLTGAGAMKKLFASFEVALQDRGYKPVGGQIVDALLIAAPRALDPDCQAGERAGLRSPDRNPLGHERELERYSILLNRIE